MHAGCAAPCTLTSAGERLVLVGLGDRALADKGVLCRVTLEKKPGVAHGSFEDVRRTGREGASHSMQGREEAAHEAKDITKYRSTCAKDRKRPLLHVP